MLDAHDDATCAPDVAGATEGNEAPVKKSKQARETDDRKQIRLAKLLLARLGSANVIFHDPARAGGRGGGCFWLWRGKVWEPVSDRLLKQHVHTIAVAEKLTKSLVDSVLDLAKTEALKDGHEFDTDRSGINVENGTLAWTGSTWEMRPHRRDDYRTTALPVAYDPAATAPRFEQFLGEVFAFDDDRDDKARLILEAIGYSLTTSTDFERLFILAGDGANGKSVLLHVLREIIGDRNASAVQPSQFENRFQRAHMHRKLVNIVTELPAGAELPDDTTKAIVSGEAVTVEHKMQAPFEFRPYCTLWIATNHIPGTKDFSDAIFRRTLIIPFTRQFEPQEQDKRLKDKLAAELPGILNLALDAYAGVINRGDFTLPPSVVAAVADWKDEADPLRSFVKEMTIMDEEAKWIEAVTTADFYGSFKMYCDDMGLKQAVTQRDFTKRICKLTGATTGHTKTDRIIQGIRFLTEEERQEKEGKEQGNSDVPF